MPRLLLLRADCFLAIAMSVLCACGQAIADDGDKEYPFVSAMAENSVHHNICLGLAGGIERLEEGTEIAGVETSVDLSRRLWNALTNLENKELVYSRNLRLRDGTQAPICSKAAIEELGVLIQDEAKQMVETLWQTGKFPDPNTAEGRALLEIRQKYIDFMSNVQEYQITTAEDLKGLFSSEDADGLVALSGRGQRTFYNGVPTSVFIKLNLPSDLQTWEEPNTVPSYHAFLLTYNNKKNQYYVYDSDDPDGKWLVTVEGNGACPVREQRVHQCNGFRMQWRIADHMGAGPTLQRYCNIRPLNRHLTDVRKLVEDGPGRSAGTPSHAAASISTKTIEQEDPAVRGYPSRP